MALPIWGDFMKKCIEDGTLGITDTEAFVGPSGFFPNLACSGGDMDEGSGEQQSEDYYFE